MLLTEEDKKTYRAIIVLNEMLKGTHQFATEATDDDKLLDPLFANLREQGYVVSSGGYYVASAKGKQVFNTFMQRYKEYLRIYDVFSYIDLEQGEFAFARYYDFDTDEKWENFIGDDRFEDLRIAVAMFKKMNPVEIVFMSFINEDRFDINTPGWQALLMSDNEFTQIGNIIDEAVTPDQVGANAMEDIIRQGNDLMIDLLKEEQNQRQNGNQTNNVQNNNTTTEVYETVEYYQPYYDPWYVSPIWYMPLFLW